MPLPWIQLDAHLASHRKAVQLATLLDDPRAWSYLVHAWMWASQNEPSGIVRGAAARMVIEHVVGWRGEAGKLVDAMIACRWLDEVEDGLAFHDWGEHQGAHIEKAEKDAERKRRDRRSGRSKKRPADVQRTSSGRPVERRARGEVRGEGEVEGEEATHPAAPDAPHPADQLQTAWNETTAAPLPRWAVTGKTRRRLAEAALKRRPLAEWRAIFARINASPFCRGESGGSWKADPDWAMRPDGQKPETAGAVLEGKYDPPGGAQPARPLLPGEGGKCRVL